MNERQLKNIVCAFSIAIAIAWTMTAPLSAQAINLNTGPSELATQTDGTLPDSNAIVSDSQRMRDGSSNFLGPLQQLIQPEQENGDDVFLSAPSAPSPNEGFDIGNYLGDQADELTSRKGTGSAIKIALVLGALSLAPSVLLMTTCYIRIVVVLGLLKQAFGAQQLPPTQVITTLALFLTILIMTPVWMEIKTNAIDPYASSEKIDWQEAWERGVIPIKKFMGTQIEAAGNTDSIAMIYKYAPNKNLSQPTHMNEVPLNVLLPAFIISELKVAFLIGFQIFLPFLIIDLIVSSVTVSLGMMMLPPTMVSLPLKLILFVMVDGWNLVVGLLLQSFAPVI